MPEGEVFLFFAAANPKISNGGFLSESKREISALIPEELKPKTVFFRVHVQPAEVLDGLAKKGLQFPMIGKPDIGGRGRGIEVLNNPSAIAEYVRNARVDFHIQEFVPYENEVGIFYFRYPGQSNGHISGVVRKEFLSVTGDGKSTVSELLKQSGRAILQLHELEKQNGKLLNEILALGQNRVIVPYGNHARGAKFLDDSDLIDEQLTGSIDRICKRIPDFFYGRLDIRFRDWEALRRGEDIIIIEVNGAGSEPTHIYDPKHSIFFGWKEIIRHWFILWRISRLNHRLGHPYLTVREGIKMFREDKENSKKLLSMKG